MKRAQQQRTRAFWVLPAAAAVFLLALWIRWLEAPLVAVGTLLAAIAIMASLGSRAARGSVAGSAVLGAAFVLAAVEQRSLSAVRSAWQRWSQQAAAAALADLENDVRREVAELERVARLALELAAGRLDASERFEVLARAVARVDRRSVSLDSAGQLLAWGGTPRVAARAGTHPVGIVQNPFYTVIQVAAVAPPFFAVAGSVLHAEPPAERFVTALDRASSRGKPLRRWWYFTPPFPDTGWVVLALGPDQLLGVRPEIASRGEVEETLAERARARVSLFLALALALLLGAFWRTEARTVPRLGSLIGALTVVAIVPLNAFSNFGPWFDPGVYFTPLGGPFTGNVAALALSGAIALLGLLGLLKRIGVSRRRWVAGLVVLTIAGLGPFLMRDLARGIMVPLRGASTTLWVAWEIALFLAGATLLLAGARAGRDLLGQWRGISPLLAPALALGGSLLAPVLFQPPGRWPPWYPIIWILTMGSLALSRRSRLLTLTAAFVAACGSTILVWGAVVRRNVQLAQSDVARLANPDPALQDLVVHFAEKLAVTRALEREALLRQLVTSPLSAAGHAMEVASWSPGSAEPATRLRISRLHPPDSALADLVERARAEGSLVLAEIPSEQGLLTAAAVSTDSAGAVATVTVAPHTLLIPPRDPFGVMLGLTEPLVELPYELSISKADPSATETRAQWVRTRNEFHGDWIVRLAGDTMRAHAEVVLRDLDALIPRGALLVFLDMAMLALLWSLVAAADGALGRWLRQRAKRWRSSYRARLTLTLFGFFVVPAAVFALWSYYRLNRADRETRTVLVQETLRNVVSQPEVRLEDLSERIGLPLLQYRGTKLVSGSDSLYTVLAPLGQTLPPPVALALGPSGEAAATSLTTAPGQSILVGYRAYNDATGAEVLAAPVRLDDRLLDRERRDIAVLVSFVTLLGALAALILSGVAARELERPVGALRQAALRLATGGRIGEPAQRPAFEFAPVFEAFRKMDNELWHSRKALEDAKLRTEAVLRRVASGVAAYDESGDLILANPRMERILGRTLASGSGIESVGVAELVERVVGFLGGAAEEERFDIEVGHRQLRGNLLRLEQGGVVLTLDDVTELARAERVLAWGEMARQVAHEVKNPLTPIRLGVQHLLRAHRDRRVDFDRLLQVNATRILREIDRLDEIARAFSRYGMVPREQGAAVGVEIAAVIGDAVELEQLGGGEVEWRFSSADRVQVLAREAELREVLVNVLENARQAGARRVDIELERDADRVTVLVRDDGQGIPREQLSRIFEPRFSTKSSGSGLGLAISRALISSWGGNIEVTSRPGGGTEVRIVLSIARSTDRVS